jgi:hypothetical protein
MDGDTGIVMVLISALLTIGWVVYVVVDGFRRRQQLKVFTDFHGKLIDRLGSAREFGEFFTSDAGDRFLSSLSRSETGAPHIRILRSMQTGLVLVALGIGLFVLVTVRPFSIDAVDGFVVIATGATAVGTALLISTGLSYVLSKRMGLIEIPKPERDRETTRSA